MAHWIRFEKGGKQGFGTLEADTISVHEGDMFSIVSTGPSSISINLTYDKRRLTEAIKKISGSALAPKDILDVPLVASFHTLGKVKNYSLARGESPEPSETPAVSSFPARA